MGTPRQEIIRFLELSVLYLPIAAVLIWGVFSALKSRTSRSKAILLSALIVGVGWTLLGVYGGDPDLKYLAYWWINILICLVAGLILVRRKPPPAV